MIAVGKKSKKNKNKDRWSYCHHVPMLPLFGNNRRLPLLHMAECFISLEETKKRIIEFEIGYMINPSLHVNKYFRDQVEKCMNTIVGKLTQSFIKAILSKNNTRVLSLIMFHETIVEIPKKAFRVLSCVICTIKTNISLLII